MLTVPAHWAWQQLKKLTLDFTSLGARLNFSLNFHLGEYTNTKKDTDTQTHTIAGAPVTGNRFLHSKIGRVDVCVCVVV